MFYMYVNGDVQPIEKAEYYIHFLHVKNCCISALSPRTRCSSPPPMMPPPTCNSCNSNEGILLYSKLLASIIRSLTTYKIILAIEKKILQIAPKVFIFPMFLTYVSSQIACSTRLSATSLLLYLTSRGIFF